MKKLIIAILLNLFNVNVFSDIYMHETFCGCYDTDEEICFYHTAELYSENFIKMLSKFGLKVDKYLTINKLPEDLNPKSYIKDIRIENDKQLEVFFKKEDDTWIYIKFLK